MPFRHAVPSDLNAVSATEWVAFYVNDIFARRSLSVSAESTALTESSHSPEITEVFRVAESTEGLELFFAVTSSSERIQEQESKLKGFLFIIVEGRCKRIFQALSSTNQIMATPKKGTNVMETTMNGVRDYKYTQEISQMVFIPMLKIGGTFTFYRCSYLVKSRTQTRKP